MDLTNGLTIKQFAIRFVILLALMFAGNIIFLLIANVYTLIFWNYDFFQNPELLSQTTNPDMIPILRFFQGATSIGMFLVPGLVWAYIYDKPITKSLDIKSSIKISNILLMLVLIIAAVPLINALAALNESMEFPSWMQELEQSLRNTEENAVQFMEKLLKTDSFGVLIANLLVIAVLPAISEEVLFRGVIQKEIIRVSGKPILSIIVAALIFSAMHLQFFTFLPRFILGIMLGLVFYWSKNLWVPILLHFFNNAMSVLAWYWLSAEEIENSLESVGTTPGMQAFTLGSLLIVILIFYYFRKSAVRSSH